MAKKKKRKKPRLRAEKEVRRVARLEIGQPPAERIIPNKRDRTAKHKKTAFDLSEE